MNIADTAFAMTKDPESVVLQYESGVDRGERGYGTQRSTRAASANSNNRSDELAFISPTLPNATPMECMF